MRWNLAYPVFAVLSLTLALAGCRREPLPGGGDVLRFSVDAPEDAYALTRAYSLPGVTPPADPLRRDGNRVRVWGSMNTSSNVFNSPYLELVCEGNGSTADWDYAGDRYYWYASAAYQFRSVFTDGHDADIQSGDAGEVRVAYPGGYDLLVAAASIASDAPKEATLTFRHACAAVRFFCVDPSRGTATTPNYSVTRFSLRNVAKTGTLAFTGTSTATTASVTGWTPGPATGEAWSLPGSWEVPDIRSASEVSALTPWFYFVPQTLGEDAAIELSFSPATTGQTITLTHLLKDSSTAWEPGKMYTYFIVIEPAGIRFEVGWANWGDPVIQEL